MSRIQGGRWITGERRISEPLLPLVTVVTVVLNRARHIEETITAVLSQSYPNVEYIIIDGGSTDGTREIIERYNDRIGYWVSEKDAGLYHAMNKGIELIDDPDSYVVFSHSDDSLAGPGVLAQAVEMGKGADFIYGTALVSDPDAETLIGRELTVSDLARETVPHPASLVRRRIFDQVGPFDTRYRIAADYDFIVRCFQAGVSRKFVTVTVARLRMWGISENQFLTACRERKDVVRRHFSGSTKLKGVMHVNLYDIPRNVTRNALGRVGLLKYWRRLRSI